MEVHNPQLLPPEIIRLADYFGVRRLVALRQDPRQGERERQGRLGTESDGAVTLFLNRICRHGLTSSTPKASLWLMLLDTLLHEAGHTRQPWRTAAEYRNSVKGWGYWQCYAERDARCFAERELLRLADLDEDLWMPSHNRGWGYLGARLSRVLAWRAAEARQAEGFPVRVMLAIWAAKLNAGDHVRWNDALAPHCTRIHQTSDGRRWRFLTVAQTARRLALSYAQGNAYGTLLCLGDSPTPQLGWDEENAAAQTTAGDPRPHQTTERRQTT